MTAAVEGCGYSGSILPEYTVDPTLLQTVTVTVMSTAGSASLKLATSGSVHVFRIEGAGKARESKAFHDRAESILLAGDTSRVVLDVSACTHLESAFLGGIADLYRRFGDSADPRFYVRGSPALCKRLFGPTRLDTVVKIVESGSGTDEQFEEMALQEETPHSFGRHVMLCHRRLAELEGPDQKTFAEIAARLAQELEE